METIEAEEVEKKKREVILRNSHFFFFVNLVIGPAQTDVD